LSNLRPKQIQAPFEYDFRISGHTLKSEDFETTQEKLTTCSISKECFDAMITGLWPAWLFIMARYQKQKQ